MKSLFSVSIITATLLVAGLTAAHVYLLDGLDGTLLSLAFDEDTVYAEGYTNSAFRRVARGLSEPQLLELLGPPLGEVWIYGLPGQREDMISFSGDKVRRAGSQTASQAGLHRVFEGMSKSEVVRTVGTPPEKSFVYAKSRGGQSYRVRTVKLSQGVVRGKRSYFYVD